LDAAKRAMSLKYGWRTWIDWHSTRNERKTLDSQELSYKDKRKKPMLVDESHVFSTCSRHNGGEEATYFETDFFRWFNDTVDSHIFRLA
jgi:hypothetical protein